MAGFYSFDELVQRFRCGLEDFGSLLFACRLNDRQAADYLGVDERSIRRYRRTEPRKVPETVILALRYRRGDLSGLGAAWQGVSIKDDTLYLPEGLSYTVGEVRTIALLYGRIQMQKADNRVLREEVERLAAELEQRDAEVSALPDNVVALFPRGD